MLRYQSQLQIDSIPDEQLDNMFEVVMPALYLNNSKKESEGGIWSTVKTFATNAFNVYNPIVEEISFGVRDFGTNTRRVRTGWCNVPDDIQNYKDVSITFFCSSGMLTQYYLETWKKLVFDDEGEYYNPMSVYKKDIEVFFTGPGGVNTSWTSTAHYTLKGCFPYSQDPYKLQYTADPKRLTLTARFKMDKIVFDADMKTKAIAMELVSNPSSIIGKAVDQIFADEGAYSAHAIYG